MPNFSRKSRERLHTCHDDLIALCESVIVDIDFSVICGFRGKAAQNHAYETGNSTVPWPHSKHNRTPSWAVDIAPWPQVYKSDPQFYHLAGYVMARAEWLYDEGQMIYRVRWGGDWNMNRDVTDNDFNDLGHFELVEP